MCLPVRLLAFLALFTTVYSSGLGVGGGLCDGGSCSQCTPLVYNSEITILELIQKVVNNLNVMRNDLQAKLVAVSSRVNKVDIDVSNAQTIYINKLTEYYNRISAIIEILNRGLNSKRTDFIKEIHRLLKEIREVTLLMDKATKTINKLMIEITGEHTKMTSLHLKSIEEILRFLVESKSAIVDVSNHVNEMVKKLEMLINTSNSLISISESIGKILNEIKMDIMSIIRSEQEFLATIQQIIQLINSRTTSIIQRIDALSSTATKIQENLKLATSTVKTYESKLNKIIDTLNKVRSTILDVQARISTQKLKTDTIINKINEIFVVARQNRNIINSVYENIKKILKSDNELLVEMQKLLQFISINENKINVLKVEISNIVNSIAVKISQAKTTEESNYKSVKNLIDSIKSNADNLEIRINKNTVTTTKLEKDINSIVDVMNEIVVIINSLKIKCNEPTPGPPAGRCENPSFDCTEEQPVCASDGRTYRSECDMRKAACIRRTVYTVVNQGPCITPTTTTSAPCSFTCPPKIDRVCASNGRTYTCKCTMELDSCQNNLNLYVVHKGRCKTEPQTTAPPARCTAGIYDCGGANSPVCASNGQTYLNVCQMRRSACLQNTIYRVVRQGPCTTTTTTSTCNYNCEFQTSYVCGSDTNTYMNLCQMKLNACVKSLTINLLRVGRCDYKRNKCDFVCAPVYKPVCGTNGQTYTNICELARTACLLRSTTLRLKHRGACRITTPMTTTQQTNICQFFCAGTHYICADDGKTYQNECRMLEAACIQRKNIKKLHKGPCGATCTSPFINIAGRCYYIKTPEKTTSQNDAIVDCAMRGSLIAHFDNDDQYDALKIHIIRLMSGSKTKNLNYWVGAQLVTRFLSNKWMWYGTNKALTLKRSWAKTEPNGRNTCAAMYGRWAYQLADMPCTANELSENYGWICVK